MQALCYSTKRKAPPSDTELQLVPKIIVCPTDILLVLCMNKLHLGGSGKTGRHEPVWAPGRDVPAVRINVLGSPSWCPVLAAVTPVPPCQPT